MKNSPLIDDFVNEAESFISWVGNPPADANNKAIESLKLLSGLYYRMLTLISLDMPGHNSDTSSDKYVVDMEEWKEVYDRLNCFPFTYYFEAESPHEREPETHYTDLTEDLTDIYQDVKEGLMLFQAGEKEQAVCHWQMTFEFHWGSHVLSAMKALHCYFQIDGDFSTFSNS